MLSALSALLTRPIALATSVALHAGVVALGGHALSGGTEGRTGPATPELEVQLFEEPLATPAPAALSSTAGRASTAGREIDARAVAPTRATGASHRPPSPVGTAQARLPEGPPRFVLGAAVSAATGMTASATQRSADAPGNSHGLGTGTSEEPLAESAVDQPARLMSSAPLVYPESARVAGVEADVLLELVVDGNGRVTSARELSTHELGLAEAAARAVRAYRFTPARRQGRAVPVRMRWTVTFRLQ